MGEMEQIRHIPWGKPWDGKNGPTSYWMEEEEDEMRSEMEGGLLGKLLQIDRWTRKNEVNVLTGTIFRDKTPFSSPSSLS